MPVLTSQVLGVPKFADAGEASLKQGGDVRAEYAEGSDLCVQYEFHGIQGPCHSRIIRTLNVKTLPAKHPKPQHPSNSN